MKLLFYCYEGSGLGHLTRLARLASFAAKRADVLFLTGHRALSLILESHVPRVVLPSLWVAEGHVKRDCRCKTKSRHHEVYARQSDAIRAAVDDYAPDLVITDHRPRGLRGELDYVLERHRCRFVLLMRGVLDAPSVAHAELAHEFENPLIDRYSLFLVCADPKVTDMASDYSFLTRFANRMVYTGYMAPDVSKREQAALRKRRLQESRGSDRWAIVSAGAGTYHGRDLFPIAAVTRKTLGERWLIDVVTGPYADPALKCALDHIAGIRVHRDVHALHRLHMTADLLISPGGSNTILEGVLGCGTVVPVPNADADEIRLVGTRLHRLGLCHEPIDVDELASVLRDVDSFSGGRRRRVQDVLDISGVESAFKAIMAR